MKFVKAFFRWLLTMNTVWGLMIVSAFGMTAYKHNTAVPSRISSSLFKDGANELAIVIPDEEGKDVETTFTLQRAGGRIDIPDAYKAKTKDNTPYLVAIEDKGDKTVLKWFSKAAAKYTVKLNGAKADGGNLVKFEGLTNAAFEYAQKAFELGLKLVAAMVLLLGIMKIGEEAGLVQLVARVMRPVIRFIFPDVPADHPATGAIIMFFTTGMLGVGNAATPFGIIAMTELQKLNKYKNIASDSMIMLLGWSTAGIQLVPTTIVAVRKAAGCSDPFLVIGPCIFAGTVATIFAMASAKLLSKLPMFSIEAAVAEDPEGAGLEPDANAEDAPAGNDASNGKKGA